MSAYGLSVTLDGTRTVLTGTDCGIATYRFGTTSSWNGTPLDLHVEVNSEDNDLTTGNCVDVTGNVLSVYLRDTDAGDDVAFVDVTLTLVQQGTLIPVSVDRITATGFDLDANGQTTGQFSTGTDDIYLSGPGASYLSGATNVTYSTGNFAGGHTVYLKGQSGGNCADTPTTPVPTCRASATWVGGATNIVSSISARFQNDNAYGQYLGTANALRLLQLSLDDSHAEELLADTRDHGDTPNTYADAIHPNVSLYTLLGNGLASDNEATYQSTVTATGDDTDAAPGTPNYDDEDAVKRGGIDLDDQTFTAGSAGTLDVTTFGDGYLSAWIDFNRDNDFNDPGEKIGNDIFINSTTVEQTSIPYTVPIAASGGASYARFRFNKTAGVASTGLGAKGEVEDYRIIIDPMQPEFNMVKSSDSPTITAAGTITYTFEFTNSGNVPLTNLSITDPDIDAGSLSGCPIATLAVGAIASCSATRTVTQADIDSGSALTNTANPSATDPAGGAAPESDIADNSTSTTVLASYTYSLDKPAPSHVDSDGSGDISVGDTLNYTVTATNTGTGTLTNLQVSDALITPSSIACASVLPTDVCVLNGSYTVSAADVAAGSIANTATADADQVAPTSATQTVPLPTPLLTIDKAAPVNADEDGSTDVSVGDTLTYTVTATNSGTANLTSVVVADPLITPNTITCASLAPGADCVLTGVYTVTAADSAAGVINNTATADSDQTAPENDSESVPVPNPEHTLTKSITAHADNDGSTDVSALDVITYTITATNTGTAILSNLVINDPLLTPASVTCASVVVGGTCVLTGTYQITAADVVAGGIVNTATSQSDQTPVVDDSQTIKLPLPVLDIVKSAPVNADGDGSNDTSVGDVLTYTITATNTGAAILTNVVVSDPLISPSSQTCAQLSPSASCVLTGTYTVTAADVAAGTIDNTASADSDQTDPITDQETVTTPTPELIIAKAAPSNADEDASSDISAGDTLTYVITVTNNGTSNLTNVAVTDSRIAPSSNTCPSLAPAAICTLTGDYTVTAADVTAGLIQNTASAVSDQTPSVDDTETVVLPEPSHTLQKSAPNNADEDNTGDISIGDTLTYTITATNNGTAVLTNLLVADAMIAPASITCASVPPTGNCVLTGSYSVTAADVSAGVINNTATASSDQTSETSDDESVVVPSPSHTLDKAAPSNADEDGSGDISAGDTLTYTLTATNTGAATLNNLVISDTLITPSSISCAVVPPGGTCVLSGSYIVTAADVLAGSIVNSATSDSDQSEPADDTETVVVPTPALSLDKSAPANADEDGSADISLGDTLTYTVTATNSGASVLTNVVVTDVLLTPSTISCASLAPGATCVLIGTYAISSADMAAGVVTNTAEADSDQTDMVDDTELVSLSQPDHAIDKPAPSNADEDNSGDVSVGDTLTYTITATNIGSANLTNMVVSDPLLTPKM